LLSTVFFTYCGLSVVLVTAFALFSSKLAGVVGSAHDSRVSSALFLAATLYALALPWNTYTAVLRGLERVDQEQAVTAVASAARTGGLALVTILRLGLVALAAVQGAAIIARGFAAYMRSLKLIDCPRTRWAAFSIPTFRSLIRPSMAFFTLQVAGVVGFGIDNLVIGHALGPEAVTRYAVAYSLIMMAAGFFSTGMAAVMPTITLNLARSNHENVGHSLLLASRLAILYGTVASVLLSTFGPWLLQLWAGASVFPGIETFRLQIALLFIQIFIEPPYAVLLASTRHYGASLLHVFESALNLTLSLWWVRRWGLPGVIAGTVVARLLTTGWYIPLAAFATLGIPLSVAVRKLRSAVIMASLASVSLGFLSLSGSSELPGILPVFAGSSICCIAFLSCWWGLNADEKRQIFVQLAGVRRWVQST
jgi:O-antigen/teichoic acid export membrane protein